MTGVMHTAGRMYRKRQRRTRPAVNKFENFYTHGRIRLQYFYHLKSKMFILSYICRLSCETVKSYFSLY